MTRHPNVILFQLLIQRLIRNYESDVVVSKRNSITSEENLLKLQIDLGQLMTEKTDLQALLSKMKSDLSNTVKTHENIQKQVSFFYYE